MMEKMELRPPKLWAMAAGASEFGGGLLTALGLLNPRGHGVGDRVPER